MIFACCHPALNADDQLAFTLKTVSGFSVAEISRALQTNEPAIQKRLYRARKYLQDNQIQLEIPAGKSLDLRLDTVHTVLYLIFNEGYNSTESEQLIRKDLCAEAMRLCKLLSEHRWGKKPSSFALLSLMCFQASRFESRVDENHEIILLSDQDRNKWDKQLIALGYHYLSRASEGEALSIFHLEAAIAAEHCLSLSFKETNWERMLGLYDLLLERKPSPLVKLNRSVVLAQTGRVEIAIRDILSMEGIEKLLDTQYMYPAVLGDLYLQAGQPEKARDLLGKAYTLTGSQAEKKLIASKLANANSGN
jgi:RNA polymerase sigma-70 factor (ECF subfamily)